MLVVAACTAPAGGFRGTPEAALCREGYRAIDASIEAAEVRDAEAHRMPGFPYLRASRFLASFRDRDLDPPAFAAWVDRLQDLDRQGRTIELANLAADERARLDADVAAETWPNWSARDVTLRCPAILRARDLAVTERRIALRAAASVPDDYSTFERTAGIYPITAIPVALGFERWQTATLPAFDVAFGRERWQGQPLLFVPGRDPPSPTPDEVARTLESARANPLGLPEPEGADLDRLARAFAPAFLIDVASEADLIGHPYWSPGGPPEVDPSRPVVFVRLAHTWLEGRPAAQLVYLIWFQARPRQGAFDLLGGPLDGLIWRVTLGHDGRPLVYDTIHACGCYHLFFPVPGVARLPLPQDAPDDIRETALVPQAAPALGQGERMVVRLASGSHYVTGLASSAALEDEVARERYGLMAADPIPDAPLRSMPLPEGGRRSLYGPDGLIEASARLERFILWPMGIASAGAMRQWGRHATAFVGRRHFDDPRLLERAFAR